MGKQITRRGLLRTFGLTIAGSALAACAPKVVEKVVKETAVVKETVAVEVEKQITVVVEAPTPKGKVVFWGHDQHPLDLAGEGFVQKYPEVVWESPHPADWGAKLQAAMAAGSGCPDLVWLEATQVANFGCAELLFPTSPVLEPIKDQFHPAKLAEAFVPKVGQYCGWPGDISLSGYYYRPDKFAEVGYGDVDWESMTWDDFIVMATDVAKQGKKCFLLPTSWSQIFDYCLQQIGGLIVSKDGQSIQVGDEKGIAAMNRVKQLYETGAGINVDFWSPPYWTAITEGTLIGDFGAAWNKGFWEAQIKTPEQGAGYWRITKFPKGPDVKYRTGVWGGATLAIPKCAENKENALLYMQYALGSLEGCALTGGWGIIPAYRPYLNSTLFTKGRSHIFGDWAFNEFWTEQEKGLSPEYVRPAGYGEVMGIIAREMPPILKDEISVDKGMANIVQLATPDFERAKCVM